MNAALNRTGDGESAEEFVDTGNQDDAGTNNPPRPLGFWILIAVTVLIIGGGVYWNFILPPGDRYFWATSPDDWAAWGTWAGAVGSIGAVYFASLSIKHAIEAQKGTERELKRDRVHDREEREKERALVREEREALTKEVDRIALNEAGKLRFSYSTSMPLDSEYAEVQIKWSAQEQSDPYEAVQEDDYRTQVAYVVIENRSKDLVFNDITLWLREDRFKPIGVEVADRDAPPARESGYLDGSPPKWTWRTDYEPEFPPGENQWALGSVNAGRQLLVKFSFADSHRFDEWSTENLWHDRPGYDAPRHLILGYRDQAGRYWIRSTRSPRNRPQRLLEAKIDA
jgi:hypothetical protein